MSEDADVDAVGPHEARDESRRGIALTGAAVALLVGAALILGGVLSHGHPSIRRPLPQQRFLHGPADIPDVVTEWPQIESEMRWHLETYGWVDRPHGVVRIPIAQAMKRVAEGEGNR